MKHIHSSDFLESNSSALVLEGGAMRGVFTCGVLDCFMDNNISFPYVIGVSAGACNGASYVSNQKGRAKYSNIDLLEKYKYVGLKHYLKKGNLIDFDLLFDDFPNRILPFDFKTYSVSNICFEMVVSNCETGKAEYLQEYKDQNRLLDILKASSSMPFFSPITSVDSIPMLDGGICDSIPAERAISQGYNKLVIVLTRNKGYRKTINKFRIPSLFLRKYPQMLNAINNRNALYNQQLELIDKLEEEGKAIVIRPLEPMTINRIEKNIQTLTHFYLHGYQCAEQMLNQ